MKRKRVTIDELSRKELYFQAYLSQLLLLIIAIVLIIIFHSQILPVFYLVQLNWPDAVWLGCVTALLILLIEWLILKNVGSEAIDDGGINKKLFSEMSYRHMLIFCFVVSVVEEILFRAVLQSLLGLVGASLLFTLVHVRYITKPVLFSLMISVSFLLGLLFHVTENILAPIVAHFVINMISGVYIRLQSSSRGEKR